MTPASINVELIGGPADGRQVILPPDCRDFVVPLRLPFKPDLCSASDRAGPAPQLATAPLYVVYVKSGCINDRGFDLFEYKGTK